MADKMVEDGFREAGYVSVHIDDCWTQRKRDDKGYLLADDKRFASGMGALADYVKIKQKQIKFIFKIKFRCIQKDSN